MKILLIEDDQALADAMQQALNNQKYLVDVAIDGQTGLCLAQLFDYHLILLDLMLPDLDGLEFCAQRRQGGDHTPILVVTASYDSRQKLRL